MANDISIAQLIAARYVLGLRGLEPYLDKFGRVKAHGAVLQGVDADRVGALAYMVRFYAGEPLDATCAEVAANANFKSPFDWIAKRVTANELKVMVGEFWTLKGERDGV